MKVLPFCLLVCLLPLQATASEFVNTTCTPELENTRERYEKFKRQHVDKKMAAQKCTAAMKQKKIYDDNNVCKKTNTFILADAKEVQSVCKGQGIYNNESHYTESKKKFRIVVCTVKKQARKPKCEYKGKCLKNRVIAVSCKDGLPVHFAGDHQ
ncbi:ribonuclease CL2-like [Poecilia formosa]|uniref:ribonuclease CL2-like n=1 Tax=Poecilia formosa TaxID=48698 RepID=UPI0007BA2D6E|nr:PREDICTED: ribonuclease CL2-like [Poecilia formosa]